MSRLVVDASALLRFIDGEVGSQHVEDVLNRSRVGDLDLLMSAINWGEVVYSVLKAHGLQPAQKLLPKLRTLPFVIIPADTQQAELAAHFKHLYGVPYADSFAGSLALSQQAPLLTADHDFKSIPAGVLTLDLLPVKSKP